MLRHSVMSWAFSLSGALFGHPKKQWRFAVVEMISHYLEWPLMLGILTCANTTQAFVLWSDLGTTLVHNTGEGHDILGGVVKEDDSSTNTLYFKFRVDPLSDASTEEYFGAFELYEGDKERLGIGNALKAWAYSAFFHADETGATLALTVPKYFWQNWWFIGLSSLTLLVLVGGGVRFIVKREHQRRLKHLEQEHALERERTRIAQDLHDEMGAKLCRISFLSEHARRNYDMSSELQHQIVSISDASREALHSLDEIVWAVNPQNDTLEHVASYVGHYAQEFFQETGIECKVNISGRLPQYPLSSQVRHHLLLAVDEAFTNVLKHSRAEQVSVFIVHNAPTFEIVVSDNGIGFNSSVTVPQSADSMTAPGDGLRNMKQRLADIGGHCFINSKPGQGVTIRFILPLASLKEEESP